MITDEDCFEAIMVQQLEQLNASGSQGFAMSIWLCAQQKACADWVSALEFVATRSLVCEFDCVSDAWGKIAFCAHLDATSKQEVKA